MPARSLFVGQLAVAAALCFGACDSAPGPASSAGEPPTLSNLSFDPQAVAPGGADEVDFTLHIGVTAVDPDGDLDAVGFIVQSPSPGAPPVAEGALEASAGDRFEQSVDVSIPRGNIGLYTVLAYGIDARGALSNNVRGMLRLLGSGEPPVIEEVVAPDTVTRPAQMTLVAVVSDPDGLSNISGVDFWNVTSPEAKFAMFDDGGNDDETAADGRFSRIVVVTASNQPGENRFAFQATDKAGLKSNVVEKTIVVE